MTHEQAGLDDPRLSLTHRFDEIAELLKKSSNDKATSNFNAEILWHSIEKEFGGKMPERLDIEILRGLLRKRLSEQGITIPDFLKPKQKKDGTSFHTAGESNNLHFEPPQQWKPYEEDMGYGGIDLLEEKYQTPRTNDFEKKISKYLDNVFDRIGAIHIANVIYILKNETSQNPQTLVKESIDYLRNQLEFQQRIYIIQYLNQLKNYVQESEIEKEMQEKFFAQLEGLIMEIKGREDLTLDSKQIEKLANRLKLEIDVFFTQHRKLTDPVLQKSIKSLLGKNLHKHNTRTRIYILTAIENLLSVDLGQFEENLNNIGPILFVTRLINILERIKKDYE